MAERIFIGVEDGVEGADLARCLGRHGLRAGLVRNGVRWQVEVKSLGEDPRSFFVDVGVALATWSGARGRSGGAAARRTAA